MFGVSAVTRAVFENYGTIGLMGIAGNGVSPSGCRWGS